MVESECGRAASSSVPIIEPRGLSRMSRRIRVSAVLMVLLLATAPESFAQNPRLELGRRLKRFEIGWEAAPITRRVAAVPFLKTAVRSFFSLRLTEAGRQLDNAWLAIRNDDRPNSLTHAMIGSQLLVSPLCAETEGGLLALKLTSFYPTDIDPTPDAIVQLKLARATGEEIAETEFAIPQLKSGADWKIDQIPEGDHVLSVIIRDEESNFALPPISVSRIKELTRRLQELKEGADALKAVARSEAAKDADFTLAATLRDETRFLENVIKGVPQEADFPVLQRLENCEAMLASRSKPFGFAKQLSATRQVWLALASGRRFVPTRVHLPPDSDNPAPVLFVFHGAGGSENMFFETYGAGRVINEAAKRGWIVVSPRQGLFGLPLDISEMLAALEMFVPLDRKRVMLLGHSMGASQAVTQVKKHPALPVAAVALGGGGRVSDSDAKRSQQVSWFIGAGDQDFGLSGALQMNRSLTAAKSSVHFEVYENVEHLVVVQAAIDDVFQFLDETLAKLPDSVMIGTPEPR
ncbi:MAG: alpha/beta fold hydrolase [Rubripirellula sp.]|nr:alpha/beta fold hydrolase [Rubripirellula sp.]